MNTALARDEVQVAPSDDFWSHRPSLVAPMRSPLGGRGLAAIAAIPAGALIEKACTVEISAEQAKPLDAMQPLGDFYFENPADRQAGLMAFGLMSLCNHHDNPNADIRWHLDPDLGWIASLTALRAIMPGEEVTYRYKCPLWFAAKK